MGGVIDVAYEITSCWVPSSKYSLKCSYAMTPQGIVVHNTAGSASAQTEAANMVANASATSYHVVIDEAYAVECIPFSRNAWHAGDGSNGYANRNLIGIEIARSMDWSSDLYDRAEANAVEYIAWVCIQYGWDSSNLHQHNWYSSTACPHRLKDHWATFCNRVDQRIAEIQANGGQSTTPSETPTDPVQDTNDSVKVSLQGKTVAVRGKNIDGTVYVSVRDLLSQMGYDIGWQDNMVTVEYKGA